MNVLPRLSAQLTEVKAKVDAIGNAIDEFQEYSSQYNVKIVGYPRRVPSITSRICRGAKKVIFTACHSGKLKLTFTSPNIISTSPKNVLMSTLISQFFCNLNSSKNFICPLGKLTTEFTSPIAKSTSPGLSNTTFFARCFV